MQTHRFEGLAEFREVLPQLASASSHPVYIDLREGYSKEDIDTTRPKDEQLQQLRHQGIWNDRDDRLAYIGTDKYEITQHEQILNIIDNAVGQTVGEVDLGRIRDYGERIDGMLTLEGHSVDVGELVGDGYVPPEGDLLNDRTQSTEDAFDDDSGWVRDILGVGIRFHNSFDASERIRLETMGYRFICQNWMVWGKETIGEFSQLHINELNPEDVEDLIFDVLDKQDDISSVIVQSVEDDEIPLSWVQPALEDVGFGPQYQKDILKQLRNYGNVGTTCSRWELYNAATAHLDHSVAGTVNPNVYDRHQEKAIKLLTSEISSPKEEVPPEELLGKA